MSPLSPSAGHTGFDVQVRCRPGAVAITHAGRDISYGELDARAQAIAGAIGALGLPRETRVGIYLPRVPDLVATMFAICRAGYCSVPMDPAYPSKRLEFMAADASIAAVVTDAAHAAQAPGRGDVLVVDELGRAPIGAAAGPGIVHPRQLSHIIYTSGSTGVPKGVAIDHGGLSVFLGWVRDTFSDRELSGTLASTSVCFDVSTFEIFGTLSWGGRIVLVDNVLAAAWSDVDIRMVSTVPSAMREIVNVGGLPPTTETVTLGGEAVDEGLVESLHRVPSVTRVVNIYGPSEDTTVSSWAELHPDRKVTIGRLLPGGFARVLGDGDSATLACPGAQGELLLGGAGVARGYLDRPGMTAARFLPDPCGEVPGARVYRTGDLVRVLDNEMEYHGRTDHQVKVRGFRVELEEVGAALTGCPVVRAAVAVVEGGQNGHDAELVAYLVARSDRSPDSDAVRDHVRQILPLHMVPNHFRWLERLPTLPNGKVDRAALTSKKG
jgi:amino acid adenylation domain-containing protein